MPKLTYIFLLLSSATYFVLAAPRVQLHRGLLSPEDIDTINQPHPYLFPHAARGRAVRRKAFETDEQLQDYEDNIDKEDYAQYQDFEAEVPTLSVPERKKSANKLALPADQSGGILVPDGVIEVEGETVFDPKTGQTTLLVPRQALEAIPDGSIVALLDGKDHNLPSENKTKEEEDTPEERANRVLVRRRKTGSRLNLRSGSGRRRQRQPAQRKRRPSVHVLNQGNTRRRRVNKRSSMLRPVFIRG